MNGDMRQNLSAWGRKTYETVQEAIAAAGHRGAIARGLARSYGDACLNDQGSVIDLRPLSRIIHFDPVTGAVQCEAGVSFAALMQKFLPMGLIPATCPGTAMVTMGGAVANDVHGKNQHGVGCFGDHLDWIDLVTPDGKIRRLSNLSEPDLFYATVGGIGMTGVIVALQFRLMRAPSNAMLLQECRVADLDGFLDALITNEPKYPYAVGWIDAMSQGAHLGRGILELASPSDIGISVPKKHIIRVPFDLPSCVLNRYTVAAFNELYFR
ncbi:MAG: decaprenylphosphoryl-beta-D-ribose oxidase, partial [Halothiobacillaceae bacterium]